MNTDRSAKNFLSHTEADLERRFAEDEVEIEAYIERNREGLNRALEEGYLSLDGGEGVAVGSFEDFLSAISTAAD